MIKTNGKYGLIGVGVILVGICFFLFSIRNEGGGSQRSETATQLETSDSGSVQTLDYGDEELKVSDFYKVKKQNEIAAMVDDLKKASNYTMEEMLYISNPFQTNTTGLYVYFETDDPLKVEYTIHVEDNSIADYTQTLFNAEGEYATVHEYQVIGLVPGEENTITFFMTSESGDAYEKKLTYKAPELMGKEEVQLPVTRGLSTQEQSNGLYTILGNDSEDQDFMYYYDNDGVIRGEIPIIGYRSHRILFDEQAMYMSVSEYKMAKFNHLGQVTKIYDLSDSGYSLHHDYNFDEDGNIIILATDLNYKEEQKLVEDQVVLLDTETGEVSCLADFSQIFPDLYEKATGLYEKVWDPVHFNSVQYIGDDSVILSARETSAIVKLDNIYEKPEIDYMISDESMWEDIGYTDLLLDKKGDFTSQAGQHSVTYVEDDSLDDGQCYLYMFNNNVGILWSREDFDWSNYPDVVEDFTSSGDDSSYYKYLVDENEGTYELVDSLALPYSAFVSSVQEIDDNIVFDSGQQGIFGEYDKEHNLIRSFKMTLDTGFIYRVFKYDFVDFYFADGEG